LIYTEFPEDPLVSINGLCSVTPGWIRTTDPRIRKIGV